MLTFEILVENIAALEAKCFSHEQVLVDEIPIYRERNWLIPKMCWMQFEEKHIIQDRLTAGRAKGSIFCITFTEAKITRSHTVRGTREFPSVKRYVYIWANGDVWASKGTPPAWADMVRKWVRNIRDVVDEPMKRRRIIARCRAIKEDLMMNRWHPDRVGHFLMVLGIDVDDM